MQFVITGGGANYGRKVSALIGDVRTELRPQMLEDLARFNDYYTNFSLSFETKQYRPRMKPLTSRPPSKVDSGKLKRKRKLIVRDWFHFVVWHMRIRKLLSPQSFP